MAMLINYGPSYAADLEFSNPWSKIFKCSHCCGLDLKREQRTRWTTLAVTDQQRELWRINERFTTFINNFSSWASSRAWVFRATNTLVICCCQMQWLLFWPVRLQTTAWSYRYWFEIPRRDAEISWRHINIINDKAWLRWLRQNK